MQQGRQGIGRLLALARAIDRVSEAVGRSVGWLILGAVLVSATNAVVRRIFSVSSSSFLELQLYLYGAAFLPTAVQTLQQNEHIDLIWFGVILGVTLQTSFLHPPFGFSLFYLRSVAPKVPFRNRVTGQMTEAVTTGQICCGEVPFVVIQVVMIGVVMAFPSIVMRYKGPAIDASHVTITLPKSGGLGGGSGGGLGGLGGGLGGGSGGTLGSGGALGGATTTPKPTNP